MIHLYVTPARIERVEFEARSDIEDDFDTVAWRLIRSLVNQIDRRLRAAMRAAAEHPSGGPRAPRR